METPITIRINLEEKEVEFHGDANYIKENFGGYIKEYLDMIKASKSPSKQNSSSTETQPVSKNNVNSNENSIPDSFGEYLNKFPKGLSNVDKLLVASYYAQMRNQSKQFTVVEASAFLVEQGVKLSNPNVFNKLNENAKRIFKISGKNFRVSESGTDYIKTL